MTKKATSSSTRQTGPRLPAAPRSIQKGSFLGDLLDREAIDCLAHNIGLVHPQFDGESFQRAALEGLKPLAILQRGQHLARALRVAHDDEGVRERLSVPRVRSWADRAAEVEAFAASLA